MTNSQNDRICGAKCSVAMATYNGALYIEKQILSIINQTRRVNEIVISDDGSSDDTLEIVRKLAKSPEAVEIKFKILTDNPRHGFCGNFEHAISHCDGDYIFICDQDDIWLNNKVERVINLNYSCTSETASANGCALSDINITDILHSSPPKKGILLPWVIVFLLTGFL